MKWVQVKCLTSAAGTAELCWIQMKVSTMATATATLNVFISARQTGFSCQVKCSSDGLVTLVSSSEFSCLMPGCVQCAGICTHFDHCCIITGSTCHTPYSQHPDVSLRWGIPEDWDIVSLFVCHSCCPTVNEPLLFVIWLYVLLAKKLDHTAGAYVIDEKKMWATETDFIQN